MRLRRKAGVGEKIREYGAVLAEPRAGGGWHEAFGRPAPLWVELGTGKGRFISELASREPGVNLVGIEAQLDVLYQAAKKVAAQGVTNVRLLHFDAACLPAVFAPGEIDRLYINFCDPWPKKRHAKRRLTNRRFLARYREVVRPGGRLCFKTDNAAFFAFSLEEFAAAGLTVVSITRDLHADEPQDNIMTEYEAKFRALGVKICRCEAVFGPQVM